MGSPGGSTNPPGRPIGRRSWSSDCGPRSSGSRPRRGPGGSAVSSRPDPGDWQSRLGLARAEQAAGRPAEATRQIRDCLEARPDDPQATCHWLEILEDQGDVTALADALGRLPASADLDGRVWSCRGLVLLAGGDVAGSIVTYRRAAALRPARRTGPLPAGTRGATRRTPRARRGPPGPQQGPARGPRRAPRCAPGLQPGRPPGPSPRARTGRRDGSISVALRDPRPGTRGRSPPLARAPDVSPRSPTPPSVPSRVPQHLDDWIIHDFLRYSRECGVHLGRTSHERLEAWRARSTGSVPSRLPPRLTCCPADSCGENPSKRAGSLEFCCNRCGILTIV